MIVLSRVCVCVFVPPKVFDGFNSDDFLKVLRPRSSIGFLVRVVKPQSPGIVKRMLDIIVDTIVEYSRYGLFLTAFSGVGVFSSIVDGSVVGGLLLGGDRLFFGWACIDVGHIEQLNKRASNGTSSCQLKNAHQNNL